MDTTPFKDISECQALDAAAVLTPTWLPRCPPHRQRCAEHWLDRAIRQVYRGVYGRRRLTGMLLVAVAVPMLLSGVAGGMRR